MLGDDEGAKARPERLPLNQAENGNKRYRAIYHPANELAS